MVLLQFLPTAIQIIFRIFYRITKRFVSTRNQSDHQGWRHSESRGDLRSIEYAQTSTCAGTQIKDTSPLFHPGDDL